MSSIRCTAPPYILLLLLLGFLAMFAAFFHGFMHKQTDKRAGVNAANPASGTVAASPNADSGPALSEQQVDELVALMSKIQTSPDDADALMEIGNTFLAVNDWERAVIFLNRAVMSRPSDIRPRYMLGIALYQQGKIQEAAATFEELLALEKDPAAQYNLAVIYKYHMDKSDEAAVLFEQIAASPDADTDTVNRAKKEL